MRLLISCTCVVLSPMSIYPNPAHKLEQLFSLSKIKAPDTRSPLTWVILQPLTFPSLKQAQACTLIDPADGLGANLPGTGRRRRYFTAQSDAITLKINTFWTAADLPTKEDGWAGCLCTYTCLCICSYLSIRLTICTKHMLSKASETGVRSTNNQPLFVTKVKQADRPNEFYVW